MNKGSGVSFTSYQRIKQTVKTDEQTAKKKKKEKNNFFVQVLLSEDVREFTTLILLMPDKDGKVSGNNFSKEDVKKIQDCGIQEFQTRPIIRILVRSSNTDVYL